MTQIQVKGRQLIKAVGLVGTVALITAACSSSGGSSGGSSVGTSGGTYNIGVLADLSGPVAGYDQPNVAGLQTYIDAVNKKGGVDGHKLALKILDTKSDVPTARTDFSTLQGDGVIAIDGPILSTAYSAVQPLATKAKIALLSIGAPPDAVQPAQPYFYLTGIPLPEEAVIAVKQIAQKVSSGGTTKVAALSTDSVSTQSWRDTVASSAKSMLHSTVTTNLTLAATAIDPSTQVAQIVASKPDYVLLRILASQVPLAVKDLREKGFTGEVISDYGGGDTAVLKQVNDPKYLAIRDFDDPNGSSSAAVKSMVSGAKTAGQSGQATTSFFTYGYVSGALIVQTLKACGDGCTSEKFNTTLAGSKSITGVPGLSGPVGLAPGTHSLFNYGRLYKWDSTKGVATAVSGWINGSAA